MMDWFVEFSPEDGGAVGGLRRLSLVVLVAVGSLTLVLVVIGPAAWWVGGHTVSTLSGRDRADAINAVRQTLLTAFTGLAASSALVFTGRSFYLNRRGQLTDRYVKAVALLASPQSTERVGGVFALEHLMYESRVDHDTIVQVLAAFVRDRCPVGESHRGELKAMQASRPSWPLVRCPADVQAALTVIGRRPERPERPIDLSQVQISGADLTGARLSGATLVGSVLSHATLIEADLSGADLTDTVMNCAVLTGSMMQRAWLVRADLRHAILGGADLSRASLSNADLRFAGLPHAVLTRAHMIQTRLDGADLVRARLTGAYMAAAVLDHAVLYGALLTGADLSGAQLDAADLRHVDLTGAILTDVSVIALNRTELTKVLWRQLETNGQVLEELFDTLDDADPDYANLSGIRVSAGDRHRFPALPEASPLPPEKAGYIIGRTDSADQTDRG